MGWVSYVICPETDTRGRYYESGELKMAVDPAQAKVIIDRYQATMHQPLDVGDERLRSNPPLLAHYTSVEVAEQIIKNEEIWLSHPFYMNDLEELRFGMLLGIQRFPAHVETLNETPQRKKALLDAFAHFVGYMNEQTLVDTYVLCLSEHAPGDTDGILSMWRNYANQGHGVALVFNTRPISTPPQAPLWIAKVVYKSPTERIQMLENGLQQWVSMTQSLNLQDDRLYLAAYAAFYFIKTFALVTKHKGFAEEAEWRVIYVPDLDQQKLLVDQFGYHISQRGAEPKLKFKIKPVIPGAPLPLSLANVLEFILLGPSHSSPLAQAAFRRMLRGTSIEKFQDRVFASTIPLRPKFA